MKKPPFVVRYFIIGAILVLPPILSTHYGTIFLGKDNGVLLGLASVSFVFHSLVGSYLLTVGGMTKINEIRNFERRSFKTARCFYKQ